MTSDIAINPRCRVGDLAVVVNAEFRTNIGRIVRIIKPHDGKGDLVFNDKGFVWFVECVRPMTWMIGKKRYRRKRGPVPDIALKPIRGHPAHKVIAVDVGDTVTA